MNTKKILWVSLFLAFPLWAAPLKYSINRDHSNLNFSIEYMTISKVQGQFQKFQGDFLFDQENMVLQNIFLEIVAESLFTNNKMRDGHLKRPDFLDVQTYPGIVFQTPENESIKLNIKGEENLPTEFTGQLTLKGVTRPTKVTLTYLGKGKDTWNKENVFFLFHSKINRAEFNLQWNKTLEKGQFLIGESVEISGNLQAQIGGEKTAASRFLIPDTKGIRLREQYHRGEIDKKQIGPVEIPSKSENPTNPIQVVATKPVLKTDARKQIKCPDKETPSLKKVISLIIVGFFGFIGSFLAGNSLRIILTKSSYKEDRVNKLTLILIVIFSYIFMHAFYIVAF